MLGAFALARAALSLRPLAARCSQAVAARMREYLDAFIAAGLVALFLATFIVRPFLIPSGSMLPTLQQRDVLLVNELAYRFSAPRRGDIAVFTPPIPSPQSFIKRIIGVPGDELHIAGGRVYVNGKPLNEPYLMQRPGYELQVKNYTIYVDEGSGSEPLGSKAADIPPRTMWQYPNRIPRGFYFVMGDNRNDSDDSHVWGFAQLRGRFVAGPLAKSDAIAHFTGRAFLILWPAHRLRVLSS